MVKEAENEYKVLLERYEEVSLWLQHNIHHPDFYKRVSLKNDLSVQLEVKRQQKSGNWNVPYHTPGMVYTLPIIVNK